MNLVNISSTHCDGAEGNAYLESDVSAEHMQCDCEGDRAESDFSWRTLSAIRQVDSCTVNYQSRFFFKRIVLNVLSCTPFTNIRCRKFACRQFLCSTSSRGNIRRTESDLFSTRLSIGGFLLTFSFFRFFESFF